MKISKGIIKVTFCLIFMLATAQTFAKGAGPSDRISGSTVWGYSTSVRYQKISSAHRAPPKRFRGNRQNRQQGNAQAEQIFDEIIVEGKQYSVKDYLDILENIGFRRVGAFGFLLRNEIKPKKEGEYITREWGTCDQGDRVFKVWDMHFREKKFDPKHELITIYWRDEVGIYRKNHKLPTSLIWTEVSFRHLSNRCNYNI